MAFLVEDLIESVKARSFMPISQSTFQEADIVRLLNEELSLKLVSDILGSREDFFLTTKSTSLVAGKDHYLIPTRSIGNNLKAVFFVDPAGNRYPLERRDVDRSGEYNAGQGDPEKFYFEGDEIVLLPKPSVATGSILFSYFRKPNQLTLTSNCAKITAISTLAGITTMTVDTDLTVESVSVPLVVGSLVDILRGSNPHTLWAEQCTVTAVTPTTIELSSAEISDVDGSVEPRIGDYVCPSGYANIVMVPEEFVPVLAQMGVVRALASLGDMAKLNLAKAELEQMRKEALSLIRNRVESAPDTFSRANRLSRAFGG